MAWKVPELKRDTEDNNIVTATAIWTLVVDAVEIENFTFERRYTVSAPGRANFVAAAQSALVNYQTKLSQINTAKQTLEDALNA